MNTQILGQTRTLSIMPTYTCSAACKDCGTLSSPQNKENISIDIIIAALNEARKLNFGNVVFTGGEATLRFKDLLIAIRHADSLSLFPRLVTNAHWASNSKKAFHVLEALVDAGLKEINFSTGDEHVRFVPIDNVALAVVTSVQKNLPIAVMIESKENRTITSDIFLNHNLIKELPKNIQERIKIIESPWMPMNPFVAENYEDGKTTNAQNLADRVGCESVLQTYTLQANGSIGACCGLGMRIIPELNVGNSNGEHFVGKAINKAEADFLKIWIHYKGPEKILAWASEKDSSIMWENMYSHKCQACLRLYKDPKVRKVIKQNYQEMMSEVILTAYFDEIYIPNQFEKNL